MVNEHFFDERNEAGGHYGQTLISYNILVITSGIAVCLFSTADKQISKPVGMTSDDIPAEHFSDDYVDKKVIDLKSYPV